ncbi:MAG TPA: NAD-dependent epimerase/dehydratase family protein [Myxococcota bacterium]|jgi:nucleoside-diphosphate-sugar epimerase|nr:NAD-dependent epimerase/dehydratase family protein [Myxococcota bacterium]
MISQKRVLITGGAGFIGSYLVERLCADNDVVVFDNLWRNAIAGTGLLERPRVRFVQGDVLDRAKVFEAVKGCTHVIHLAAIAGVDTVLRNPVLTMKVSLLGTMHVLDACLEHKVERVIDFSTSEVFGSYAYNVNEGDLTPLGRVGEARWTYAVSKLATEHLAMNYFKQYALPSVSVRPFNIYGPRQVGEGAVHHFVRKAISGETLQVHNDGAQIRSWCYIDDIADGIMLALERAEAVGHSFNVGNPRSTITIYRLAREVVRLAASRSAIEFVPWDGTDVELRIPNIGKARALLGFEPQVDLEEGLVRTIDWYRRNPGPAAARRA